MSSKSFMDPSPPILQLAENPEIQEAEPGLTDEHGRIKLPLMVTVGVGVIWGNGPSETPASVTAAGQL